MMKQQPKDEMAIFKQMDYQEILKAEVRIEPVSKPDPIAYIEHVGDEFVIQCKILSIVINEKFIHIETKEKGNFDVRMVKGKMKIDKGQ